MSTALVYSPEYLDHDPGYGHPESRERLVACINHLSAKKWFETLPKIDPIPATRHWIELIHSNKYIEKIHVACLSGASTVDSPDVGISRKSYATAVLAAGGPLKLADEIISGRNGITNGFALIRPPGHHAELDMALGFCLFNNIAILARYLQKQHGLDKLAILDWDVHHGNGTQHSFEADPSVFYISIHQYPYYPGTGSYSETGTGRGKGATLNCPLPANSGNQEYEMLFREIIIPAIQAFRPECILISSGFDAHKDDPLAQMQLTTNFYGWMTERVMELADQCCQNRIISVLEGGYNLQALPRCLEAHLKKLASIEEAE